MGQRLKSSRIELRTQVTRQDGAVFDGGNAGLELSAFGEASR